MERAENITYGLANATEPYPYKKVCVTIIRNNSLLIFKMIIDTEWGGFGDNNSAEYIITQYDKLIDEQSEHPGVNT